ncbi:synaptotagmin 16 [Plakobranchus ocellatus]|uniref:Synaptotagmin 16 n=1 Tax=Plakobranchus ocellatus TaxID=259542 RepID=A0AAV4CL22_9GAST|nr:synaptotagmin 16 [Plakobranchus ocellatus]
MSLHKSLSLTAASVSNTFPVPSHVAIPLEAVIFLVAVLFFVLLLIVFFLYLNKSLCFSECGGFPCIDKVPEKNHTLDSDTEEDLQEVHSSTTAPTTNRETPAPEEPSRKSRGRSQLTAADGGEAHDGNGTASQDGGKENTLFSEEATTSRRVSYSKLKEYYDTNRLSG